MHFGTYMGIYWILKFILFPLGFHIPFLSLLFVILTLAVPFIGYHYVKMYRDKICGGSIQFSHAVLFTIFMYMFASLLVAVVHYIYFQFIDHGFIQDMAKVQIKSEKLTPFGGIFSIMEKFDSMLSPVIDSVSSQIIGSPAFCQWSIRTTDDLG